jgi:hypothetical protein
LKWGSTNVKATGQLVVGHGWVNRAKNIDSYKGVDVRDKIVIVPQQTDGGLPIGLQASDLVAKRGDDWEVPIEAALKLRDILKALRRNLKAFLTTGIELVVLCPTLYADSCADTIVLLSALKDGIVEIDDSGGKILWKPSPDWSKLEAVLP